jgi:hypothetical protein
MKLFREFQGHREISEKAWQVVGDRLLFLKPG